MNKFFHQCLGTAMGTAMAPSYANLYMAKIENKILKEFKEKTGLEPSLWLRFLDNVFFVWSHSKESLEDFTNFMQNSTKEKKTKTELKVIFEIGKRVPFLDVMTYIGMDGKLETDLYSKPTDAHLYLRSNSCHPKTCTKGLVKGKLLRARRICSKENEFKLAALKMKSYFVERGFSGREVDKTIKEVSNTTREEALQTKQKKRKMCGCPLL
jgi:hypothetical protein